ncbi:MAG: helix-turn-helix domain-containing protein [Comamonas sp.]|jgi:transcriptional regulator with XRE-family HTH domain|uniref:helix-turn-helix domain-containing protein n=1 Tax=Comamonas sp. TaxID=34028 RepID=UPI002846E7AF|nr:helix-turn-helix transcriptional regulator [Comamonas sp.]MDR3064153.1 helix-turn-helix domain-containing protein [Comamonas sp.]
MPIPKKQKPKLDTSSRELLATNLVRLRIEKKWTQEELSYESGLHRTMVGQIERQGRNVTLETLESLAAALNVEIWELFLRPEGFKVR